MTTMRRVSIALLGSLALALALPAVAAFYMFATVHSAVKFWSGRGGEWKGRAQDAMYRG